MPNFTPLSNSFWAASVLGVAASYCIWEGLAEAITGKTFPTLFIVLSFLLIMLSHYSLLKHKIITGKLLKEFQGIEEVTIGKPTIRMFLQQMRTPKDKIEGLEKMWVLFWYASFALGLVLHLFIGDYKKGIMWQESEELPYLILVTFLILVIRYVLFLWDIPYLKRIYEEHSRDQHSHKSR